MSSKTRLDILLFERGLAISRERAKALIMSGKVYVDGVKAEKPGIAAGHDASIEVRENLPFVSRGGRKLEKALDYFNVSPEGKACLDCGASTGGFTDCLLKNGARLVYAVDVGYGQLAWSLRSDPRVITMERTNIRYVTEELFEEKPELAVIDVSFISLSLVLPVIHKLLTENGEALCLIKPQFEAGREKVGKKGVIRDPQTHKAVLDRFIDYSGNQGFIAKGITYSPLRGPEGNIEYFSLLGKRGECMGINTEAIVRESHEELRDG
jgi:23S rRNA (cytidine1920-2'-O)/16S rRNA (cytidine1409-2'-O)-methyltransferase